MGGLSADLDADDFPVPGTEDVDHFEDVEEEGVAELDRELRTDARCWTLPLGGVISPEEGMQRLVEAEEIDFSVPHGWEIVFEDAVEGLVARNGTLAPVLGALAHLSVPDYGGTQFRAVEAEAADFEEADEPSVWILEADSG